LENSLLPEVELTRIIFVEVHGGTDRPQAKSLG
jgi:hypothetical protein